MQINVERSKRELFQNDCDNIIIDVLASIHVELIFIPYVIFGYGCFFYLPIFIGFFLIAFSVICLISFFVLEFLYEKKSGSSAIDLIKQGDEFNSTEPHHAIIIAHKKEKKNGFFNVRDYSGGVDKVLMALRNQPRPLPYRVYDIDTVEKATKAIENPCVKWLWIFGHGQRNKLKLTDGMLCYYHLRNITPKEFIGQYHCNSPLGNSLADYLNPPISDVTRFSRFPFAIEFSVKRKLVELGIM